MKLRDARLCINCDEVYEAGIYGYCPACGSEVFGLLSSWIPSMEDSELNEREGGDVASSTALKVRNTIAH